MKRVLEMRNNVLFLQSQTKKKVRENGAVAQSVEQRTENPCVAGSIPAHTTSKTRLTNLFVGRVCFLGFVKEIGSNKRSKNNSHNHHFNHYFYNKLPTACAHVE